MSRDIALNIAINAGQAVSEAERLRTELEATEQAVEGLSATEITARGFSDAAVEIDGMRRAAEALGEALGPELSSKLGANGFAGLIADARTAGATFDEIIADADTLAGGVRDLDTAMGNVDTGGLSGIAPAADIAVGGVRRVGDEAGRSRQAMGSLAGESVQQLGGLLGPLQGVSYELGSIADQALSGSTGIGALAAQGVALGGIGVGIAGTMQYFANQAERAAEAKAFNTEEAEQFADALGEAGDNVANLAESLRQAGEVEFLFGEGGFGQQVIDIQPLLTELGLTADQTAELLAGGAPKINEWGAAARAAGADGETLALAQLGLLAKAEGLAEAQGTAAEKAKFLGESQRDTAAMVSAAEEAVAFARDQAAAAADRAAQATQREVDALRDSVAALDEQVSAQRGAVDAGYALADSQDAFARATVIATQALSAGTPGEQAAAYRDLAQSAQLVADNTVRVAEETATANGRSLSRKQSIDVENGALLAQAGTLNGPMRAALVEHIGRINGIPPKKVSQIEALIDQGKIGEAEGLLTRTSRTRDAAIKATAESKEADDKLTQTARDRTLDIFADAVTAGAEGGLNRTARNRALDIVADAVTASAEGGLNRTARNRALDIVASAVTASAEGGLNQTARNRALDIVADAVTASAEGGLNDAARGRTATITAEARDNASGALDAIAGVARFAYITSIVSNVVERT